MADNVEIKEGDELSGFFVDHVIALPSLRSEVRLCRHEKSGAKLLHLYAPEDSENLFSAAFRTPPPDDTGLPHILEHTVLCGSEKYPVKDPFVELLKTSMATFLNAMTYPDKTVYPCASMNEKDFFNLTGVYCDAVFNPMITEKHFKQEGHHFDFATPGDTTSPLIIKGIVYNEMKGAYSDLDGVIDRWIVPSLCPDNAYGLDSGGDPKAIPSLTYEEFKNFHAKYYHPSNSLIFIYGDIPTPRHLAFLDREYLSKFDKIDIDTTIADQPRWQEGRRYSKPYPLGQAEDTARKTAVCINFLTNPVTDAIDTLGMHLLDHYLLSNAASPLRKALIDSKLGEELTDSGYAAYQRDTFFTVGLKGTEADKADAIVDLVMKTCTSIVEQGLDADKVEAAFHRLEISSREIKSNYPLHMMDRVLSSWLYDADPLHNLRIGEHLERLRELYETEERFFEKLLQRLIIENQHYSVLTLFPDKEMAAREESEFTARMAEVKGGMSQERLEQIAKEAVELEEMQSTPNSPESLATLPKLHLSDIPPEPAKLPTEPVDLAGNKVLYTDIFANGLNYINLAFDLSGLEDDLYDYLPVYSQAMRKMGAAGLDFAQMAGREAACSGGIGVSFGMNGTVNDPRRVRPMMTVASMALDAKLEDMLSLLSDRIAKADFGDKERFRDILLQAKINSRSALIPSGNRYASARAARHLSRNAALKERTGGITAMRTFDRLAGGFDAECAALQEKMERIRKFMLNRSRVTASFVGDGERFGLAKSWLGSFLGEMSSAPLTSEPQDTTVGENTFEGVATPADVAFVASVMPSVAACEGDAAALLLLGLQLSFGVLWNEIRVKNGAYGARASYSAGTGEFSLSTYRDPFIKESYDVFGDLADYIQNGMELTPEAVEQYIVGTVKTLDVPIRPGQAVSVALARELLEETPEFRKQFRQNLLSLDGEKIRNAAAKVFSAPNTSSCVISSREKLDAANEKMQGGMVIEDL